MKSAPSRIAVALLLCLLSADAIAQNFPVKPLRIVVRAPPGGTDDLLGRLISQRRILPRSTSDSLSKSISSTSRTKVVAAPDYRERIANAGMEPASNTPEQMLELAKQGGAQIDKIIRTANIRLE